MLTYADRLGAQQGVSAARLELTGDYWSGGGYPGAYMYSGIPFSRGVAGAAGVTEGGQGAGGGHLHIYKYINM